MKKLTPYFFATLLIISGLSAFANGGNDGVSRDRKPKKDKPKKEKNGSINKVRSGILPVIKKLLTVASGAALTFSGLVALYQGGVLSADQKFFSYNFYYEKMFLAI